MKFVTLNKSFGFNAKPINETGQIFRKGAKVIYHDWHFQNFTINISANAPWDQVFESEWFDSMIPSLGELPPGGQGFT